jgi:hypothetical protein
LRYVLQPPNAAAIVNSLRAIGYSFNTAVADIIDNSIAAGAARIDILFSKDPLHVAVVDDGVGMSEIELIRAMQHGGNGPETKRAAEDLGRYGLGLKTASISQCRRLTVVTVHDAVLSGARWDLDEVERENDWVLGVLSQQDARQLPGALNLERKGHGTIVLWENFDRATAGESSKVDALQKLVLDAGAHLALVFHRFLSPRRGRGIEIFVNSRAIEAVDPFMRDNSFTDLAGQEQIQLEGSVVRLKAYILPHFSKMSAKELDLAGGRQKLRDSQGFYVYRNRRLIVFGTWFRLLGRDELTRLARIQVDIPNALDHLWGLDVKKSTATPPEVARVMLRQIIDVVAAKSGKVFQDKQRRSSSNSRLTFLWDRFKVRDGLRYAINRQHPAVSGLVDRLQPADLQRLKALLSALELGLPVRQIYVDQASDQPVEQAPDADLKRDLEALLVSLLAGTSPSQRRALLGDLLQIDPFLKFPEFTRDLIASEHDPK